MMTIMIRYSGDDDDGDNYDNIQVTMIRYSGDGPLLGSSAKSSSLIPTPCRFSIILLLLAYQVLSRFDQIISAAATGSVLFQFQIGHRELSHQII